MNRLHGLNWVISNSEVKEQPEEQGYTENLIYPVLANPTIVPDIAKELKDGKYIIEEGPDRLPTNQNESPSVWKRILEYSGKKIGSTLGRGFLVLNLVLKPAPLGNSTALKPEEKVQLLWGLEEEIPQITADPTLDGLDTKANLKYVTYTKFNPNVDHMNYNSNLKQGRVYIGRSSGYDHPCKIVQARDTRHTQLNGKNYQKARMDTYVFATKSRSLRYLDPSYWYIRGRENKVIRDMGEPLGRLVDQLNAELTKVEFNRFTRSANKIWGISATNSNLIKGLSKTLGKNIVRKLIYPTIIRTEDVKDEPGK